jgi:hypothetical protein
LHREETYETKTLQENSAWRGYGKGRKACKSRSAGPAYILPLKKKKVSESKNPGKVPEILFSKIILKIQKVSSFFQINSTFYSTFY